MLHYYSESQNAAVRPTEAPGPFQGTQEVKLSSRRYYGITCLFHQVDISTEGAKGKVSALAGIKAMPPKCTSQHVLNTRHSHF